MSIVIDYGHIFYPNAVGAYDAVQEDDTGQMEHGFQHRANILANLTHIIKKHWKPGRKVFICLDGKEYWRQHVFPPYKIKRKDKKKEDNRDWGAIYRVDRQFVEELRCNFAFWVIGNHFCEADDVVAVVAREEAMNGEDVVVISSDKDFIQLQVDCPRLKQYDRWGDEVIPKMTKKLYGSPDPRLEREIMILIGDERDGVPNVFNTDHHYDPDHTKVKFLFGDKGNKERLKTQSVADIVDDLTTRIDTAREDGKDLPPLLSFSFGEGTAAKVVADDPATVKKWGGLDQIHLLRNYRRNRKLIDLNYIPDELVDVILAEMEKDVIGTPHSTVSYITNRVGTGFLKDEGIPVLCLGDAPEDPSIEMGKKALAGMYSRFGQGQ